MNEEQLAEIDRACAERLMRWRAQGYRTEMDKTGKLIPESRRVSSYGDDNNKSVFDWQPTRNISQAWEVLEKVPLPYFIIGKTKAGILVEFTTGKLTDGENSVHVSHCNDSAPLAICLAALRAVGWEGGE